MPRQGSYGRDKAETEGEGTLGAEIKEGCAGFCGGRGGAVAGRALRAALGWWHLPASHTMRGSRDGNGALVQLLLRNEEILQ